MARSARQTQRGLISEYDIPSLPSCLRRSVDRRDTRVPLFHGRSGGGPPPSCSSHPTPTENIAAQLAKFRRFRMPFSTAGLSAREVQLVRKLVEAGQYFESIYWRQSDPDRTRALQRAGRLYRARREKQLRHFLLINGSRYDLLEGNKPFIGNTVYDAPGHALYPAGHHARGDRRLRRRAPRRRRPRSTIRGRSSSAAARISSASRITSSTSSGSCRRPRRCATRRRSATTRRSRISCACAPTRCSRDDYYPSDLAWVDLENPKFDVIIAPYETYLDDLLGVKTSYGAAVLIRNEARAASSRCIKKYVPDIQEALPLAAEDRPSKRATRRRWK